MIEKGGTVLQHENYMSNPQKILDNLGNRKIISVQLKRTPMFALAKNIVNKFASKSFDNLYHLAMICNLGDRNVVVEKVAYVNISLNYQSNSRTEVFNVQPAHKTFTLLDLLNETRKRMGDYKYFSYNAFTNNCQDFIKELLITINRFTLDASNWLYQNVLEVKNEIPSIVRGITNAITNIGNIQAQLTGGATSYANWIIQAIEFKNMNDGEIEKWLHDHDIDKVERIEQINDTVYISIQPYVKDSSYKLIEYHNATIVLSKPIN